MSCQASMRIPAARQRVLKLKKNNSNSESSDAEGSFIRKRQLSQSHEYNDITTMTCQRRTTPAIIRNNFFPKDFFHPKPDFAASINYMNPDIIHFTSNKTRSIRVKQLATTKVLNSTGPYDNRLKFTTRNNPILAF